MRLHISCIAFAASMFLLIPLSSTAQPIQGLEGGIKDLAQQLAQGMTGQVKKLAIIEFPDLNGHQSALGQFIGEELITQLSSGKAPSQFDIVERRQLARVLKEQELTDSSLFDAASISKIGKILGIDAIVTGSIADLGSDVKINARAISVETAKVFAAAAAKIPKDETVLQLMRQNAGPSPMAATGGAVAQRSDVYFQNDFLRVEVTSVAVSKAKNRLSLSLVFQNTSSQELQLAMAANYYHCLSRVADNSGVIAPARNSSKVAVTGLQCIRFGEEAQNYTRLSPGSKTPVILAFDADDEEFAGDVVSFSAELLKLEKNGYSRLTVGISDIQVRQ
jgi:TolB-like protein